MATTTQKRRHLDWLLELTSVPTAAGREHRVIAWIEDWLARREELTSVRDEYGNIIIRFKGKRPKPTVMFTAHLDHPAFVVTRISPRAKSPISLEFRGGVKPPYFDDARIVIHDENGKRHHATITSHRHGKEFHEANARLDRPENLKHIQVDDLATWRLPKATVRGDRVHTPACDDLAAAAAALSAMDVLRKHKDVGDVRLLLTRAEEVGFLGAILASNVPGFMPRDSKIIALENSRSFAESPIGGGPIVRIGDRISVFHHGLVYAVTQVATNLAASRKGFRFQRKLMPGGACEATSFQSFGYDAMCVCLPLGNYHNMGNLAAVEKGNADHRATIKPEVISVDDYHHLVDLLVACGIDFTRPVDRGRKQKDKISALDGAAAIRKRMMDLRRQQLRILTDKASRLESSD